MLFHSKFNHLSSPLDWAHHSAANSLRNCITSCEMSTELAEREIKRLGFQVSLFRVWIQTIIHNFSHLADFWLSESLFWPVLADSLLKLKRHTQFKSTLLIMQKERKLFWSAESDYESNCQEVELFDHGQGCGGIVKINKSTSIVTGPQRCTSIIIEK